MRKTKEEKRLLKKLKQGLLDGMVGEERCLYEYRKVCCGKCIISGIPVIYKHNEPFKSYVQKNASYSLGIREENNCDTDKKKLEFLQKYGWLMDDEEVREYSTKYKYNKLSLVVK